MKNRAAALAAVLLAGSGGAAAAQEERIEVDVELVLAVDISYSVDEEEARRQREGYVAALASDDVINMIQGGPLGRIAVTYVEWADSGFQRAAADWTVIASEEDALAFAARVADAPLERGHYTAIGAAIADGVARIRDNNFDAPRRIIDISGDGPQNQGMSLETAHALAEEESVVVNGLPVISERDGRWVRPVEVNLDAYFEENVITGPGAFVLPARAEEEFRVAILRKLVLEIAGAAPSPVELGRAP
ncbi:MAG: DUF1194 domain-containing protein [Maricaulis sp.]|uniref:DUF1194 domain-containing protein n=1 Tax=Maricaulis sp. TaxID=1486257 RepID=UPI001B2331E8|nr:DUF1194 domain-containing protein [Maricaulis sp.]MBO6730471.1 DUF1194 domain-containing protein [Maricaulis sp.]MBO6846651.1 DUF1194 domain-containing protein [Maricaulis sp.]MBO6877765.1 DUF1194 domain-containing protein [Maricaulis sp.]MDM7984710.1 DUF1194 domain-containing protein [Maricaulis sp.]